MFSLLELRFLNSRAAIARPVIFAMNMDFYCEKNLVFSSELQAKLILFESSVNMRSYSCSYEVN